MSSAITPSTSRSSESALRTIFAAGLLSAAIQCVYLREYLSVFLGNELILGTILGVWLLACGVGSLSGTKSRKTGLLPLLLLLVSTALTGLLIIRSCRLLFAPGEAIPPAWIPAILLLSEAPYSFFNGFLFGKLSREKPIAPLYGIENAGIIAGSLLTWAGTLVYARNIWIIGIALIPAVYLVRKRIALLSLICIPMIGLCFFDGATAGWKYHGTAATILYGREGELAIVNRGGDTSVLLNNTLYRSRLEKPVIEQAVHIPGAQRPGARQALVVFDRGHAAELSAYPACHVDILESEKLIALPGSIITSPEAFHPRDRYDLIFLGTGIPENAATNRLYTVSFFRKTASMLSDTGVFSFTLPLNVNYLSGSEKKLLDAVKTSLLAVFPSVLIFPGQGFTFMASRSPLARSFTPAVKTEYLAPFILPAAASAKIDEVNGLQTDPIINTAARPIALLIGLQRWMELFGTTGTLFIILAAALLMLLVSVLPKKISVLSISTSGLAIGIYSISLLLLYQSTYGSLYSQIALLLMSLTLGFALGSRIRRLPYADLIIGIYAILSLGLLIALPYPPAMLFFLFHAGIGILGGAQFVTCKGESSGILYAADLFGGVFGMALTSTLLVPLFGIMPVALGAGAMKVGVWVISRAAGSR